MYIGEWLRSFKPVNKDYLFEYSVYSIQGVSKKPKSNEITYCLNLNALALS